LRIDSERKLRRSEAFKGALQIANMAPRKSDDLAAAD